MNKIHWRVALNKTLTEFENASHQSKLREKPELSRYFDIHPNIGVHILWKIAYVHFNFKVMISSIIKIGSMKIFSRKCLLCDKDTLDYSLHILLHCEKLLIERNNAFESLANFMSIENYVRFCDQTDDQLVNCILGGDTNAMSNFDFYQWVKFILNISQYVHTCRQYIKLDF